LGGLGARPRRLVRRDRRRDRRGRGPGRLDLDGLALDRRIPERPGRGGPGPRARLPERVGLDAIVPDDRVLDDRILDDGILDDGVLEDRVLEDRVLEDRVLEDRMLDGVGQDGRGPVAGRPLARARAPAGRGHTERDRPSGRTGHGHRAQIPHPHRPAVRRAPRGLRRAVLAPQRRPLSAGRDHVVVAVVVAPPPRRRRAVTTATGDGGRGKPVAGCAGPD
jgi:hypothetical protein